jgi:hypothetical protein
VNRASSCADEGTVSPQRLRIIGALGTLLLVCNQAVFAQEDPACEDAIARYREVSGQDTVQMPPPVRLRYDSLYARMRACVDSVDNARRDTSLTLIKQSAESLAMAFFGIPEYHDEGRLPAGGNLLGPTAYIYASPFLGTFTRKAQIFEHGTPGVLAAIVVVESGVPIPNTYRDLHLANGINCIWLYAPGADVAAGYRAYVTHAAPRTACDRRATPLGPLNVVEVREAAFQSSGSYPPVARFDEDRAGRPVLAFKCLNAFCEVGTSVTAGSQRRSKVRPIIVTATTPPHRVIKGWHDEQQLAERSGGVWRASGVWASIVPDTRISNYDSTRFHDVWVPAARIVIHGGALPVTNKYHQWGLRQGNNYLGVKFDVARNRWLVGVFDTPFTTPIAGTATPRKTWRVHERMLHRDAAVPTTARFRFTVADDGVWVPCGNSCCKSDGT